RDITRHLREAQQFALVIAQGSNDDVRLETGAVLAHAPAFVFSAAVLSGQAQVLGGLAAPDILRGAKTGQIRTLDFTGAITEQSLRAGVPTGYSSGGVEHEDRIVL